MPFDLMNTDTNPKNLKLPLPQSVTATRLDQLVYSLNSYIRFFRLNFLPAVRIEPQLFKVKVQHATDCASTSNSMYWSIEERLLEQPNHKFFQSLMSMRSHMSLYQFLIVSSNFVLCDRQKRLKSQTDRRKLQTSQPWTSQHCLH